MSNFNGSWQNQYGSVLTLAASENDSLYGIYTSSTGSTGAYYVVGFGSTDTATQSQGVGVALSILWRSYEQGKPDPSWHWVSGFGGQLIVESSGVSNIILNHDLVATVDFPGVGNVGSYIDKLVYAPAQGHTTSEVRAFEKNGEIVNDPINGTWVCQTPQLAMNLSLQVVDDSSGFMSGEMELDGNFYPVLGFADNNASSEGLNLEGVALAASLGNGTYMAFSGWLDIQRNEVVLLQQTSQGTAADLQYMQTSVQTIYMSK
jgi:saccharopepsin